MNVRVAGFVLGLLALAFPTALLHAADAPQAPLAYPPAPRGTVVTDYFGTQVADPYRWMEDVDAPQTRDWVAAERALTDSYLAQIPARERIRADLTRLWNYERLSVPFHRGPLYFTFRNSGLQNQPVLYVSHGFDGTARVLLDPNALSTDGTVALGGTAVSFDGRHLAYATQTAGSDWQTWRVREIATGRDLPDRVEWSRYSGASWARDGSGFYYEAFDRPPAGAERKAAAINQKICFHRLGTSQAKDATIYRRYDHPEWVYGADVTEDGRYLVIEASSGSDPYTRIFYRDLRKATNPIVGLIPTSTAQYTFIDNDGPRFHFLTDRDAPRGRVIAIDVTRPREIATVIPAGEAALTTVSSVGGVFFAQYLEDAHSVVRVFDREGKLQRTVALPGIGSADGFGGYRKDRDTFFRFFGFTAPTEIFRYDIATGTTTLLHRAAVAFNPANFVTEQIFATSKDGTRVPIFVSYRKGLARDGTAPTILYGYGGFDIPITPYFSPAVAEWLELGGIYAVATLRGGSEYGEDWHRAGMHEHKQNVFDDFIGAAEYLIAQKYTSTPKLAIRGESNGGLLVGAVETQRPELFGAALPGVGVMDMLRFDQFTAGKYWISEFGSATASKQQFQTLYAYSPLHNIKPGTAYPPTLISTADHDDRVFPAHSFKFAATMQAAQSGPSPILLRVEGEAGHGAGTPTSKEIDAEADIQAFLTQALHMTLPPPAQ
jgi:prolyl oligopeptidase